MKRRVRKLVVRRIFAGAMAGLMVLSAVNVSGWGVMNVNAETTAVGDIPQSLDISGVIVINKGELQADGVSGNADTVYQGTNWYYDITKNQLELKDASIQYIYCQGGDLSILLSGENTLSREITFNVDSGSNTLKINGGSDNGSLIGNGEITVGVGSDQPNNLKITGATMETVDIECNGDITIERSHIVASVGECIALTGDKVNIADSYVAAKNTMVFTSVISSQDGINVSDSQILVETDKAFSETDIIKNADYDNSIITKQWKDYDTNEDITKTYVYGTPTLKENLTIASGQSIDFVSGASITNQDKLTVDDGATILVDGAEHQHNTNGDVTYTWKDGSNHIKGVACKDCPIGYVSKETETHSIGENGFCACNEVYQSADLTTDKYDIDGDGTKDAVYEISNAGQLYWFADKVNNENDTYGSVNAVLTADIVVNENVLKSDGTLNDGTFKEWTPIGVDYTDDLNERHEYSYTGAFDGQNHTISGLYCKKNSAWNIGLFGFIGSGGKIANVGVLDSYFSEIGSVGGVCGINTGGIIINCYNTGTVNGQYDTGGVCGHSGGGTIINCYNTGVVNGYEDVGGVVGRAFLYNDNIDSTITNCGNTGAVSGTEDVGGVCGMNGIGKFENCNNTGTVSGSQYVGGVSGFNGSLLTNCNSTGTVSGSKYIGGVSGINNGGTITNCYYDSTIYTGNAIGTDIETTTTNVQGKTTEQYKTGEVAYLLQDSQSDTEIIWGQTIGTDTYPTLGGAKVYRNAIYNGCEGKPGEAVSYEYSNTEKNTYGEHPDADNDGRCDACGAMIDGIGAKLVGYSLSLNGNIGVNFYMELTDKIIADKDAYMQFTLPNGTVTKVFVSEAQTNTTIKEGATYYRFPCEVASYEMTQDIKAQMFDGSGNCGKEYTYTVRDYAQYIVTHNSYQDVVPFAVAMLNYGACSQKYFNKAVDELANKYLTAEEQEIPDRFDGYIDGFTAKKAENDVLGQFAGLSMVLKSQTTLNIFYEPKEGIDVSKLTFSVDGKEITPVKRGQYYILSLENIRANELGNSKTFTVTDGKNTLSGDYCAMMYCYQVLQAAEGTYEDDLVTLVKAFSVYAYAARSVCQSN